MQVKSINLALLACGQLALSGCAAVVTAAGTHAGLLAAAAEFAPVALMMGGVGLVGIAGVAGHQPETPEAGTLAALLAERQAEAAKIADNAMATQNEAAVAAALQAQRSIARARIAFRDQLGAKSDRLAEPEKTFLATLDTALTRLKRDESDAIRDGGESARTVADKLVLPARMPQVGSFGPYYLFSFLPFQSIAVRGNFPPAYPGGTVPQMTIDGTVYKAYIYDTQSISFSVPTGVLAAGETPGVAWKRADLSIPWEAPIFESVMRSGHENFVVLGVLPNSPGSATMEHRVRTIRSEQQSRMSESFTHGADPGEAEQTGCLALSQRDLAEGWRIKPGSGRFMRADRESGQAAVDYGARIEPKRQSEDDRSVCWRIRPWKEAGDASPATERPVARPVLWKISATLVREVAESRIETETFDLAWGASRVFNYAEGSWRLRYAKSGAGEVVFTGTDRSSPLVRVDSNQRSVRISAYPF